MNKKEFFEVDEPTEALFSELKKGEGLLNLFKDDLPDVHLFNMVDGELFNLAGSPILIYRYVRDGIDDVYDERRDKIFYQKPVRMFGHYDPRPFEENLNEFGIEVSNDQTFKFNKREIENALGGPLVPGDIIRPQFANTYFEIFEVQEDSFEAYGVYHLVCSAKILRDADKIIPYDSHVEEFDQGVVEHLDQVLTFSDGYKVMVDMRYPSHGLQTAGFPTVLLLHGSGGSKYDNRARGGFAARLGYLAISADVRGQGPSAELNDPDVYGHMYWSSRMVPDIFEYFEGVSEVLDYRPGYPLVDFDRLGILGRSQGGIMALAGAAFSEKLPTEYVVSEGWRDANARYPKILVVSNETGMPHLQEAVAPQGADFSYNSISNNFATSPIPWDPDGPDGQGVHLQPDIDSDTRAYFLANNASGLVRFTDTDPRMADTWPVSAIFSMVSGSDTHIQSWMAYDDAWGPVENSIRILMNGPTGALRNITLSTGGHGSPTIHSEEEFRIIFTRMEMFEHFMKDSPLTAFNTEYIGPPRYYDGGITNDLSGISLAGDVDPGDHIIPVKFLYEASEPEVRASDLFEIGDRVGLKILEWGPGHVSSLAATEDVTVTGLGGNENPNVLHVSGVLGEGVTGTYVENDSVGIFYDESPYIKGKAQDRHQIRYAMIPDDPKKYLQNEDNFDVRWATNLNSNFEYGFGTIDDGAVLKSFYLSSVENQGVLAPHPRAITLDPYGQDVKHKMLESFDIEDYISEASSGVYSVRSLLSGWSDEYFDHGPIMSLSSVEFSSMVEMDKLYIGEASAYLTVSGSTPEFHVHVSIFDVYDWGDGIEERYVNGGTYSVTGNSPSEVRNIVVKFGTYAYPIRKNHAIKVKIENIALHRPPYTNRVRHGIFRIIPKFYDFEYKIFLNHPSLKGAPQEPSRIVIPFHKTRDFVLDATTRQDLS